MVWSSVKKTRIVAILFSAPANRDLDSGPLPSSTSTLTADLPHLRSACELQTTGQALFGANVGFVREARPSAL
jgi:hypothetical protein